MQECLYGFRHEAMCSTYRRAVTHQDCERQRKAKEIKPRTNSIVFFQNSVECLAHDHCLRFKSGQLTSARSHILRATSQRIERKSRPSAISPLTVPRFRNSDKRPFSDVLPELESYAGDLKQEPKALLIRFSYDRLLSTAKQRRQTKKDDR